MDTMQSCSHTELLAGGWEVHGSRLRSMSEDMVVGGDSLCAQNWHPSTLLGAHMRDTIWSQQVLLWYGMVIVIDMVARGNG